MNWKNEAKDKLRRFDAMRMATINIPKEIVRLEGEFTAIRSARGDGTPIRGGTSAREDAMINNITERNELALALQSAERFVDMVSGALKRLPPDDRKILEQLFVYPTKGAVERLCAELNLEASSIYRRRDRALQEFTLTLYGSAGEEEFLSAKKAGEKS